MAAPVTPVGSGAEVASTTDADTSGSGKTSTPTSLPQVSGGSRAVDLLIDLHGKKAGIEFEAADRAAARADSLRPRARVGDGPANPTLGATPAGLFGAQIPPASEPSQPGAGSQVADWRGAADGAQAMPGALGAAAAAPAARGRSAGAEDGHPNMIRTVVQWLRDNRGVVVGGALMLLLALWGTSVKMSQRRR